MPDLASVNTAASKRTKSESVLRVLFWGTRCDFSAVVFAKLLQHGQNSVEICGVMVPASNAAVDPVRPLANGASETEFALFDTRTTPDLVQLAQANTIQVYEIGRLNDPKLAEYTQSLAVDVVCVACYPKRIPAALLEIPRYGFLNVHPSLLPAYRGPAPLFWMMRDGMQSEAGGITVHWMDETFDTGPIAAQKPLQFPDGITGAEADHICATAGGDLLVSVLEMLQTTPSATLAKSILTQQQNVGGSYQSWPREYDFALDLSWTERQAFNFIRGTKWWGYPYTVELDGRQFVLLEALGFDEGRSLDSSFVLNGDVLEIQFVHGVLRTSIFK